MEDRKMIQKWLNTNIMILTAEHKIDLYLADRLKAEGSLHRELESSILHELIQKLMENDLIKIRTYRGDHHFHMCAELKVVFPEAEPS